MKNSIFIKGQSNQQLLDQNNKGCDLPVKQVSHNGQKLQRDDHNKILDGEITKTTICMYFDGLTLSHISDKKKNKFNYQKIWHGILIRYNLNITKHFYV